MPYKYRNWLLYKGSVDIDSNIILTTYFFSRWVPRKGSPSDLPEGVEVDINKRTGLPYLKEHIVDDDIF